MRTSRTAVVTSRSSKYAAPPAPRTRTSSSPSSRRPTTPCWASAARGSPAGSPRAPLDPRDLRRGHRERGAVGGRDAGPGRGGGRSAGADHRQRLGFLARLGRARPGDRTRHACVPRRVGALHPGGRGAARDGRGDPARARAGVRHRSSGGRSARGLPPLLRRLRHRRHESALVPPRGTLRAARPGYPLLPGRAGLPGRVRAAAGAGAGDRRPGVRVPQLRRGMSARAAAFAGLRVVLVAAFNPRYHRSGRALARALTELGCEVSPCEERLRGLNAVLRRPLATRLGALLRRARADLVLVFKGTKLEPADVAELKERFGARWVNWFPDDPHELGVSLALGPAYDYLFTHDSSSLERHRRAGTRAAYLAFGCDPAYHRPLDGGARWRAPLVFVGSRDPARERVVQELAGLGLVAWGPGWPNGPAYGDDFVRVLSGATVGLDIHQHFGEGGDPARYGSGANTRGVHLPAIGTPQLSDARGDIVRHFTPDREIVLYGSAAELRERAWWLLEDDAARRSLAAAARGRALREHTWRHRLEELLTVALR